MLSTNGVYFLYFSETEIVETRNKIQLWLPATHNINIYTYYTRAVNLELLYREYYDYILLQHKVNGKSNVPIG